MVVGGQGAFGAGSADPVAPDRGGHRQEALSDAGEHPVGGASTVLFQVKLSFEGLVDRLDPLADTAEVAVAVGLVLAVGAQELDAVRCGGGCEVLTGEALVGSMTCPSRIKCWSWSSSAATTSRSPILGWARHHMIGMPSPTQTR